MNGKCVLFLGVFFTVCTDVDEEPTDSRCDLNSFINIRQTWVVFTHLTEDPLSLEANGNLFTFVY